MEENSFKSLVFMKRKGQKRPLYIVHGIGLNVFNFKCLADHLDDEQPVLALQAQGLDGTERPLTTIEGLARYYINEILGFDPIGPYLLAGYSSGAFIAFEMRKQLTAMGKEVPFLGLIDMSTAIVDKNRPQGIYERLQRYYLHFIWILSNPLLIVKYKLSGSYFKIVRLFAPKEIRNYFQSLDRLRKIHALAVHRYIPQPSNDKVYLFKAQKNSVFELHDPFSGWGRYTNNNVNVYRVPGDHSTILKPPYISHLANVLQRALNHCSNGVYAH